MIVLIGGGIGALTCAYDLSKAGQTVTVLEMRGKAGGLIAATEMDGVTFDIGAESWARRTPDVSELVAELGLEEVQPGNSSWVYGVKGARKMPRNAILGIPADLHESHVAGALSETGFNRALQDLELPSSIGADAKSLADLVTERMGSEVLEELVAPIAGGIYSTDPEKLDANTVVPGVYEALAEVGTLSGAVAKILESRPAGSAISSVPGGMHKITAALVTAIEENGGKVLTRHRATKLTQSDTGWQVDYETREGDLGSIPATGVVLAADDSANLGLLAHVLDHEIVLPEAAVINHWALVISAPELDAAPRGSGMLVQKGTPGVRAKAMTHLSEKWPSLKEPCGPGRHIVRLSYGRPGEDTSDVDVNQAISDAATLFGLPLSEANILASRKINWGDALTPRTPKNRADMRALTGRLEKFPGLYAAGSWVAGTGIAAIVEHARKLAQQILHDAGSATAPDQDSTLLLGTRGSALALTQSQGVAEQIVAASAFSGFAVHEVETEGDRNLAPLTKIGGTGVFVDAVRHDLLAGKCDFIVHSAKDLPSADAPGLRIITPERADAADALCAGEHTLRTLPQGAKIGTGSPRRIAQLRSLRPDLEFVPIRGNVPTRLKKIGSEVDGVILAMAGLVRLGLTEQVSEVLDILPAAGQGILAVEIPETPETARARAVANAVEAVMHPPTQLEAVAERKFMEILGAGCHTPVGVRARVTETAIELEAAVYTPDGADQVAGTHSCALTGEFSTKLAAAAACGAKLAEQLAAQGARKVGGIE